MIKRKYNLLNWLAVGALALASACTDNTNLDYTPDESKGGEHTVTLSIMPERSSVAGLNDEYEDIVDPDMFIAPYHISDASHINVLKFAVYECLTADGTYTLAKEFQKKEATIGNVSAKKGSGQNILEVNQDTWPLQIQLVVDPAKYYKVAVWAQSSATTAFDTDDLENVKVIYDKAKNNDELRDAFCTVKFLPKGSTSTQQIILHRPFAQINVGTAGYDYEAAAALKPAAVSYLYSQITLKGVATHYNVLNGLSSGSAEITFDWNRLPAFYFYGEPDGKVADGILDNIKYQDTSRDEFLIVKHTVDEEHVKYPFNNLNSLGFYPYVSWERFRNFKNATGDEFSSYYDKEGNLIKEAESDEHSKNYPKLFKTGENDKWIVDEETGKYILEDNNNPDYDPTLTTEYLFSNKDGKLLTDIFKYLSMCYVLVPERTSEESGAVINEITFETKGKDGEKEKIFKAFTINNVPVSKNWRTNIIADNLFTKTQGFKLYIIPDFCGDYDYLYDDSKEDNDDMWNVTFKPGTNNDMDLDYNAKDENGNPIKNGYDNWFFKNFKKWYNNHSQAGPEWKDEEDKD